jgi:hypothetical protein
MLSLTSLEGESNHSCPYSVIANTRRYANVTLRFLTDELGFDNDKTCRDFIESHGAEDSIEEKTDENNGLHYRVKVRDAAAVFEALRAAAFRSVDIKGQI